MSPVYSELNKACLNFDKNMLPMIGPYAKALYGVLAFGASSEKKRSDSLKQGRVNNPS